MSNGIGRCYFLWLLLLSGCAHWSEPPQLPPLPLLPPGELGYQGQVMQQVTLQLDGQTQQLLAAWVVAEQQLNFVGLTANGQRLLTLGYDGETFTEAYSDLLTEPLPGRQVLAHLQLAHWPKASVQRTLQNSPWRMQFTGQQRRLYLGQQRVLTITIEDDRDDQPPTAIRIDSQLMNYQLIIDTL